MKAPWFRACGWLHYPARWQGYLVTTLALLFVLTVFLAVDRHSHSVSDTFYGIFPYVVCTAVIVEWIAVRQGRG